MFIQSIRLHQWKAYVDVDISFPESSPEKNVILIGAKNGYGKTSLLEALVLGLFGRDGLPLIGRANFDNDGQKLDYSYNEFLERAFHGKALEFGQRSMSVELMFVTDEFEPIRIKRTWYFSGRGSHKPEDEEVLIWRGQDEDLVQVPKLEERDEYIRGYISQHFLPVHLARFFLFDGEEVRSLANQEMAAQVRLGIEGILGVPVLRELQDELNKYATDRRRRVGNLGDSSLDELSGQITKLEAAHQAKDDEIKRIQRLLSPKQDRQNELISLMGSAGGGDYANTKNLFEEKGRFEKNLEKQKESFRKLLSEQVALALTGTELRKNTAERLEAESEFAKWDLGKKQGEGKLTDFLETIGNAEPDLDPPLSDKQEKQLQERLKNAWHSIWNPPPENLPTTLRHSYLDEQNLIQVKAKLSEIEDLEINQVRHVLDDMAELEYQVNRIQSQINDTKGIDQKTKELSDELRALTDEIADLKSQQSSLERELEGLRGQINPLRADLRRKEQSYIEAAPTLKMAGLADKIAEMLESTIKEAFPSHINDVAKHMTKAYLAMAHKKIVKKIEIDDDCRVRLLGSDGRDLRRMDSSAGESQIFALSLISAIANASECRFPIVMDTPLARLDTEHRTNMLKYFIDSGSQVILLSQPDEVHGDYLKLIEPRLAKAVTIYHDEIAEGVGQSRLVEGYFEEAA